MLRRLSGALCGRKWQCNYGDDCSIPETCLNPSVRRRTNKPKCDVSRLFVGEPAALVCTCQLIVVISCVYTDNNSQNKTRQVRRSWSNVTHLGEKNHSEQEVYAKGWGKIIMTPHVKKSNPIFYLWPICFQDDVGRISESFFFFSFFLPNSVLIWGTKTDQTYCRYKMRSILK